MQRSISSVATAALCTGWMILAAQPAAAQAQPATQQPPASQAPTQQPPAREPPAKMSPTPSVSNQQLDKTAAAIKSLQGVRSEYAQKLSAATPDQRDKIAGEANAAMKKAVTDQGLSVDEYNSIIRLAQNDPSVRAQIEQRLGAPEK